MNQKIADIMKECYVPLVERDGDNVYDMEKFAKLIIRECINCCDDSKEEYSKSVDWAADRIVSRFNLQPIERKEHVPKCSVCGTTENVRYVGGFQPWLCPSVDCIPF